MVSFIIPFSAITHNPTAKTLTLAAPYNTITAEKVLSIYNMTKGFQIYNYLVPRKNRQTDIDITVSTGIITYYEAPASANTDIIQIIVDGALSTSSGSTAIAIYTDEALTVSGGATPAKSTTATPTDVSSYSRLAVEMKNAGASTSCTVKVMGKFAANDSLYSTLAVRTLGANGTDAAFADAVIGDLPTHIYFDIRNNDAANEASITIKCQAR